jgi:hypothetical protein
MTMRARTIGLAVIAALVAILGLAMPAAADPPQGTFQTVRNEWTNRCLDSAPDGRVYTLGCNGTSYQIFETNNDELESHATGRCIDPNWFGSVFATPCVAAWPRHYDLQHGVPGPRYRINVAPGWTSSPATVGVNSAIRSHSGGAASAHSATTGSVWRR